MKHLVNEIFDIARANHAGSFSDGADMLLNNAKDYGNPDDQYYYPGADRLDYAALQARHAELVASKPAFVAAVKQHYDEIVALRAAGNYQAVVDLLLAVESE